jgi:hypothetical protein
MSNVQWALIGLLLVSACDEGGDHVVFRGLRDGAVLGGPQTTIVDPDFEAGAIHVDLLLDDDRIGEDDFAPFEFMWNTTDYDEGDAELRALVTLGDGSVADRSIQIAIDNTRPVVSGLSSPISSGDVIEIEVSDANRIVSVELSAPPMLSVSWDAPPYRVEWSNGCGTYEVTIVAIDEAGWQTTWSGQVDSIDANDGDCDGYASGESAGQDCDDANASVNPGVADDGPRGDVNCDGVAGTDADGDGIAGLGGFDCDDSDPAIHGRLLRYEYGSPLERGGEPLIWEPGTASLAWAGSTGDVIMVINRGGTLELVPISPAGEVTTLLEGLNPGRVGLTTDEVDFSIVYARGNELREHRQRAGVWTDVSVAVAEENIDQPVTRGGLVGEDHGIAVAARAGSSLVLAVRVGQLWRTAVVRESASIRTQMDINLDFSGVATATYLVGQNGVRQVSFNGVDEPFLVTIGALPVDADPASLCHDRVTNRIYYDAYGCVWMVDDPTTPVTPCWGAIERLFCGSNYIYAQSSSSVLAHYDSGRGLEYFSISADVTVCTRRRPTIEPRRRPDGGWENVERSELRRRRQPACAPRERQRSDDRRLAPGGVLLRRHGRGPQDPHRGRSIGGDRHHLGRVRPAAHPHMRRQGRHLGARHRGRRPRRSARRCASGRLKAASCNPPGRRRSSRRASSMESARRSIPGTPTRTPDHRCRSPRRRGRRSARSRDRRVDRRSYPRSTRAPGCNPARWCV